MDEKILIVDDEKEIADLIAVYLKNDGFQVFQCYSGKEALDYIRSHQPDLAILDLMLPDINGFEICRKIRESFHYPIIMLTAKGEELDKVTGLTLGADDYVTKPFLPLELAARVKAQIRRYKRYNTGESKARQTLLIHDALILNETNHECTLDGVPLTLTPTEFLILSILMKQEGTVVSAESLLHEIWGDAYFNKNNHTITIHIRHLREKLGDSFEHPKYIKTVWGCGYKIEK